MQATVTRLFGSSLLAAGVAIASSVFAPTSAEAFTISFGANSASSNNPATGASADVDFNFFDEAGNVRLQLDITNATNPTTTFGAGATQATLMGITFDLADGLSIVPNSYNGNSFFGNLLTNVSFTPFSNNGGSFGSFSGNFDVAVSKNSNFGGGNPNGGLTAGLSTSVSFLLSGANLMAASVEDAFLTGFEDGTLRIASRFQEVNAGAGSDRLLGGDVFNGDGDNGGGDNGGGDNGGGDNGGGDNGGGDNGGGDNGGGDNGGGDDTVSVPEPTTTAGIGLIAGAMTLYRRRKSS